MSQFIGAVDLGTTSNRFILFDAKGEIIAWDQMEHRQIFPQPGWVEHDPMEIWQNSCTVIANTLKKANLTGNDVAAIGVTNQRETTVVWDKKSGQPYYNAIVWQCTRSDQICRDLAKEGGPDRFKAKTGLPLAPYFSGTKLRWILDHSPQAQTAAQNGDALFGTIETWFIWWLTGGPDGGSHVTDVSNASRTLLMNLNTLAWDEEILATLEIPAAMLPRIVPSMDHDALRNYIPHG
jgi:glycerol kinase